MEQYRINLAGVGINDDKLLPLEDGLSIELEITRKGEIWNKRTGKKHEENIIRLLDSTTYEKGFSPKIDEFITILESNPILKDAFQSCNVIELQIRVTMIGDEIGIPHIQISTSQMRYLSEIGARIDVDLLRME
jgi:hypothetical protein